MLVVKPKLFPGLISFIFCEEARYVRSETRKFIRFPIRKPMRLSSWWTTRIWAPG